MGPFEAAFTDLSFSPDSKLLAGLGQKKVVIWKTYTRDIIGTFDVVSCNISKIHFSLKGTLLASKRLGGDETVRLQVLEGEPIAKTLWESNEHVGECAFAFSSDGLSLVIASYNTVSIYNTTSGKRKRELAAECLSGTHDPKIVAKAKCMVLSQDGTKMALAMEDGPISRITLWDFSSDGSSEKMVVESGVKALAVSSNSLLAAVTEDYNVVVWRTNPVEEFTRFSLGQPEQRSWDISFSPNNSVSMTNRGSIDMNTLSTGLILQDRWIS
ncbi:MAG: hypothetical protein LQ351_007916 [Letrouitia transgressa]|nr:MAG: hypothetical protein LQ351_007916 [Letrouitia transgressa]